MIVSDDADAATDSIDPLLTNAVGAALIPEDLQDLWVKCNGGIVSYGKYPVAPVEKTTGQLMGDRRSFPLLCLIHLAAKRAFLRENGVPFWLVRVNGDDGIILLPKSLVEPYFAFMSNLWGMNRLKTYVHSRYFSFNSTFFDSKRTERVPIIRWNLIMGRDKYGNRGLNPMVWNTVREDAPPEAEEELLRYFIKEWRGVLSYLDKKGNGNNWFLPTSVGGFGLRTSSTFKITPRQRAAIRLARESVGESRLGSMRTRVVKHVFATALKVPHVVVKGYTTYASFHKGLSLGTNPKLVKSNEMETRLFVGKLPTHGVSQEEFLDVYWTLRDVREAIGSLTSSLLTL
jgi:hypothetical protein